MVMYKTQAFNIHSLAMKLFLTYLMHIAVLAMPREFAAATEAFKMLKFGATTSDYVTFTPDMRPFTEAFSLCSWIRKLRSQSEHPTWFSYAASNSLSNEILIYDNGVYNYVFHSYNTNVKSQAGIVVGDWYHYCLCWDYTSRTANIYHNGRQTGSISTPSGRRLTINGRVVLGQDQDSVGGGFDTSQAFGGELQKLNIYSKKLSSTEVGDMYSAGRCSDTVEKSYGQSRQLKWEEVLQQPRYGNVNVVDTCTSEVELQAVKEQLVEANKELQKIRSELTQTKASKDELSEELNRTISHLEQKTTEVENLELNLENTTGQLTRMETILHLTETNLNETETELHQTETKLHQTETNLNQTETKLNQTETKLNQTDTKLNQTETKLNQIEINFTQTETKLTEAETNLADTRDHLNDTLHELRTREKEAEECETRISGINCFRATNSSHWDIFYTANFYNKIITEELLKILDNSWEKLGKLE